MNIANPVIIKEIQQTIKMKKMILEISKLKISMKIQLGKMKGHNYIVLADNGKVVTSFSSSCYLDLIHNYKHIERFNLNEETPTTISQKLQEDINKLQKDINKGNEIIEKWNKENSTVTKSDIVRVANMWKNGEIEEQYIQRFHNDNPIIKRRVIDEICSFGPDFRIAAVERLS